MGGKYMKQCNLKNKVQDSKQARKDYEEAA